MRFSRSPFLISTVARTLLLASILVTLFAANARAQLTNALYVSTVYEQFSQNGTVFAYDAATGAQITSFNLTVPRGVSQSGPSGLALSGNTLFVTDTNNGRIGTYNATTGAVINANLITGLNIAYGLSVMGNTLYVANSQNNTIRTYSTNGTLLSANFITGLSGPTDLAIRDNALFVSDRGSNAVRAFSATTGQAIAPNAITSGVNQPIGVALSSGTVYVSNSDTVTAYSSASGSPIVGFIPPNNTNGVEFPGGIAVSDITNTLYVANEMSRISTYNATTGALINNAFATPNGLTNFLLLTLPAGAAVPEPCSLGLLALGTLSLIGRRRRRAVNDYPLIFDCSIS